MRFYRLEKLIGKEWERYIADPSFEYVKEKAITAAKDQQTKFRIIAPTTGDVIWQSDNQ